MGFQCALGHCFSYGSKVDAVLRNANEIHPVGPVVADALMKMNARNLKKQRKKLTIPMIVNVDGMVVDTGLFVGYKGQHSLVVGGNPVQHLMLLRFGEVVDYVEVGDDAANSDDEHLGDRRPWAPF